MEADARTRTGDPFITSEVLYQLSYVGGAFTVAGLRTNKGAPEGASVTLWTGFGQVGGVGSGRLNTRTRLVGTH
jgi:hypothetical protein